MFVSKEAISLNHHRIALYDLAPTVTITELWS